MRLALLLVTFAVVLGGTAHAQLVKLGDAGKAIADAIANVDFKYARLGETLAIGDLEPGDPAKPVDTKPLRDGLAKHKLKIVDDQQHGHATVLTVEGARGARARITLDQGGGRITLTARPRTSKPPGRCVAIPDVQHPVIVRSTGIDQRGEQRTGETFWDFKTARLHDVDGDAIGDAFVPIAKSQHACPEDVAYRVFVVRGSCGHDVGVIGPGSFQYDAGTAALDASGFRPFVMESQRTRFGKQRIPEMVTTTRSFAFKHGRYREVDRKRTTGICHHCATWSCTAR